MNQIQYNIENLRKQIPYQWKIQTINKEKTKAQCVAYIDARDVMSLLDEVVGPHNWQDRYEQVNGKFIAGIGIKFNDEWIWKHDTGVAGDFEKEKSEISDAFKRAAVKWGVGRFLYDLDIEWVDYKHEGNYGYPVDKSGKRIYSLTDHFNGRVQQTKTVPPQTGTEATEDISLVCSSCKEAINQAVFTYSTKYFNKPLCMDCQKKVGAK